jgi:hypothetical protein
VQQAATIPGVPSEIAIQRGQPLFGYFPVRSRWQDWVQVEQTVPALARWKLSHPYRRRESPLACVRSKSRARYPAMDEPRRRS